MDKTNLLDGVHFYLAPIEPIEEKSGESSQASAEHSLIGDDIISSQQEEFNTPASINANPVEEDVFTREDVQSSSKLRGQVNSTPQIRRVSSGRCFEILAKQQHSFWSEEWDDERVGGGRGLADVLLDVFCDQQDSDVVNMDHFLFELRRTGLREDDPRLKDTVNAFLEFKRTHHTSNIPSDEFRKCVSMNIVMLSRAFGSELTIKDFENFCVDVRAIFEDCRKNSDGANATYIPQLAKMNSNYWGVSICSIDGQRASFGDCSVPFTIQSVSKPLTYAVVATDHGSELVHKYVGFEPSGRTFNEITLDSKNRPHNPMINSGAIITTSLIQPGKSLSDKFDYIFDKFKELAAGVGHVGFNNSVFLSEKSTAWRNFALGYFMKEHDCYPPNTDLTQILDLYFQICSLEVTCETLSIIAATLANGGVNPLTEKKILEPDVVRDTLSICFSCGMYDFSGQFAFQVGVPAKSAVSGAIIIIIPNVCGIACFSPPLDKCGNSVRGVEFCTKLVSQYGFHNFAPKSRYDEKGSNQMNLISIMFSALQGDISAFRRFSLQGVDLNQKDYDSRTALHIAASEGHLEVVRFLVERCSVERHPIDRWGNTPLTEAERFGHGEVVTYLKKNGFSRRKKSAVGSGGGGGLTVAATNGPNGESSTPTPKSSTGTRPVASQLINNTN
ncbi:glutaminase liver isoform, mitochondrial-like isoform X3 [Symsagittifera roscoffensis]|uniref:glutaminase liver isoform, mitochondrial-like isoform X3 n=1 Tax=Symsagittifera roscoffensis TaxID=84072 RepID=UPI00307C4CDE